MENGNDAVCVGQEGQPGGNTLGWLDGHLHMGYIL